MNLFAQEGGSKKTQPPVAWPLNPDKTDSGLPYERVSQKDPGCQDTITDVAMHIVIIKIL